VHRLVRGQPRPCKGIAHRMRFIEKLSVGKAREGLARGEALRSLGEEGSEFQARGEIKMVGDCCSILLPILEAGRRWR
jgi:hypothetical protein